MTETPADTRIELMEAALLDLCERVAVLERALRFEEGQRTAMEQVLLHLTGLPLRMDRVEADLMDMRRLARGRRA